MTVEKHVRFVTSVQTIPDAFTFVMEYLDEITEITIEISPVYLPTEDEDMPYHYQVAVGGVPTL